MHNEHIYLGMSEEHTLDMGVQRLNDEITISVLQVPIVTYEAENAFSYDTSAQNQFTLTITRKNPDDAYDPLDDQDLINSITVFPEGEDAEEIIDNERLFGAGRNWDNSATWCNRFWKKALTALINRWQARTDGNRMSFVPVVLSGGENSEGVFQHRIVNANVYIKSVSFTYTTDSPEVINVQMTLVMGTMSGQRQVGGI